MRRNFLIILIVSLFSILASNILLAQVVNIGKDTVLCTAKKHILDAGNPGASYKWSTDQTTQIIEVYKSGKYTVEVTHANGNKSTDTIEVVIINESNSEGKNWIFGNNALLSFSSPPVAQTINAPFPAGTSVISDPLGNLLFYTNGNTIFDKNGDIMSNGSDLAGLPSQKSNSLIIPKPGSNAIYFVFTLYPKLGLYYSIVNMENNEGMGEVIQKNTLLNSYTVDMTGFVSNGNDKAWIVSPISTGNVFYAYQLVTGVALPIISETGPLISKIRQLKFSPDGTRVVISDGNQVHIYSFNIYSGKVTYVNSLDVSDANGIEFSKNGLKLFISTESRGELYYVDLPNQNTIGALNKFYEWPSGSKPKLGDLQLAPDGNIYIAKKGESCLVRIDKVNQIPELKDDAICFPEETAITGVLPSIPQNYVKLPVGIGIRSEDTCISTPAILSATYLFDRFEIAKVAYQIKLGDSIISENKYIEYPFPKPGTYEVSFRVSSVCDDITRKKSIYIDSMPIYTPLKDTTVCAGTTVPLDLQTNASVTWSNQVNTPYQQIKDSGLYVAQISHAICSVKDSAKITHFKTPKIDLPHWGYLCEEKQQPIHIHLNEEYEYQWDYMSFSGPEISIQTAGVYTVIATNTDLCTATDSIVIDNICEAELYVPDIFSPNSDLVNDIFIPKGKYIRSFEMKIYDRWGEMIFLSKHLDNGWDGRYRGKQAESGVYAYVIHYDSLDINGKTSTKTISGHVILVR
jgi:gliding motility-associated-like protein